MIFSSFLPSGSGSDNNNDYANGSSTLPSVSLMEEDVDNGMIGLGVPSLELTAYFPSSSRKYCPSFVVCAYNASSFKFYEKEYSAYGNRDNSTATCSLSFSNSTKHNNR